jgi:alpha-D-xyloside xylohydrolase
MNERITLFRLLQYNTIAVLMTLSLNSAVYSQISIGSTGKTQALLNEPVDISGDFRNLSNAYYLADSLSSFDPTTGSGKISYKRYEYFTRQAFDNMLAVLKPVSPNEFPTGEYAVSPTLPFSIEFISSRTLRIRTSSR